MMTFMVEDSRVYWNWNWNLFITFKRLLAISTRVFMGAPQCLVMRLRAETTN